MVNEDELRGKRIYVGVLCIGCLVGGTALMFYPGNEGLQGAMVRIGIVLGAFWLAMPTANRPAAWKRLPSSNWTIFGLIIAAVLMNRLKYMFPVLAIIAGIAYFARPRR